MEPGYRAASGSTDGPRFTGLPLGGMDRYFSWQVSGWVELWQTGAGAGSRSTVGSKAEMGFGDLLPTQDMGSGAGMTASWSLGG